MSGSPESGVHRSVASRAMYASSLKSQKFQIKELLRERYLKQFKKNIHLREKALKIIEEKLSGEGTLSAAKLRDIEDAIKHVASKSLHDSNKPQANNNIQSQQLSHALPLSGGSLQQDSLQKLPRIESNRSLMVKQTQATAPPPLARHVSDRNLAEGSSGTQQKTLSKSIYQQQNSLDSTEDRNQLRYLGQTLNDSVATIASKAERNSLGVLLNNSVDGRAKREGVLDVTVSLSPSPVTAGHQLQQRRSEQLRLIKQQAAGKNKNSEIYLFDESDKDPWGQLIKFKDHLDNVEKAQRRLRAREQQVELRAQLLHQIGLKKEREQLEREQDLKIGKELVSHSVRELQESKRRRQELLAQQKKELKEFYERYRQQQDEALTAYVISASHHYTQGQVHQQEEEEEANFGYNSKLLPRSLDTLDGKKRARALTSAIRAAALPQSALKQQQSQQQYVSPINALGQPNIFKINKNSSMLDSIATLQQQRDQRNRKLRKEAREVQQKQMQLHSEKKEYKTVMGRDDMLQNQDLIRQMAQHSIVQYK